jgi:putative ABC transport system permease protein
MAAFLQDLKYGLRMIRSRPSFTAVVVITLALGIGSTTTIFSVVNAVLLRPLPFPDADRIVRIEEQHRQSSGTSNLTYAAFLDLVPRVNTLDHIAAARFGSTNLTDGAEPEQVATLRVTSEYFAALGVAPIMGRVFTTQEDEPGGDIVVILSYGLWQRRYGGDPELIGRTIRSGGSTATVVGVMPPGFRAGYPFPGEYDLWTPLVPGGALRANRRSHLLGVLGRLKTDSGMAGAAAELASIGQRIDEENPGVDPGMSLGLIGLRDKMVAPIRPVLIVFLCAVGFLLMIACANVANLMMARSRDRASEIAIRMALGAGRIRLVRQLLTESILLGLLGGASGLLLSAWGVELVAAAGPRSFPRINEVSLDHRVLLFSLIVTVLTGIVFGLASAITLLKEPGSEAIRLSARTVAAPRRELFRRALVVSEVALALVLLIGAGLLMNSFIRVLQTDRGFDPSNVLTVNINLPSSKYATGPRQAGVLKEILERVSSAPGVRSVGLASTIPFQGGPATDFVIEGRPSFEPGREPEADIRIVDENYFRTMAIPLVAGREFTDGDVADAPKVMVINQEMARRYWPGEDPLGRNVTMMDWGPPLTGRIAGIVGDVKADGLDSTVRPMIYWPYQQFPGSYNNLVISTDRDPMSVVGAVKASIWSVDPDQPLSSIQPMEEVVATSIAPRRFNTFLLGLFATLALLLASVGIYGLISYTVAQRIREFGIRVAVGAQSSDILKLVLGEGLQLAALGVGIGCVAALALTRLMASLLFGVGARDPLTFVVISAVLAAVTLLGCYVPARRATRVDPAVVLRCE